MYHHDWAPGGLALEMLGYWHADCCPTLDPFYLHKVHFGVFWEMNMEYDLFQYFPPLTTSKNVLQNILYSICGYVNFSISKSVTKIRCHRCFIFSAFSGPSYNKIAHLIAYQTLSVHKFKWNPDIISINIRDVHLTLQLLAIIKVFKIQFVRHKCFCDSIKPITSQLMTKFNSRIANYILFGQRCYGSHGSG